ncbi:DUF389 domain-containing protein [Haliangium sp. UPWRP_2]|uniref:DUF389 domain-containing protein n=1 Tax=Haliangium sp. UPWRP_2 TaxID=1931276 RepID=UPI0011B245A4|nr:DUF389 domain-containing protein [Haliangium sp. UPWRP_2]
MRIDATAAAERSEHEKNESIEFSSPIRQIGKSQQSYGNQHSRLSLIITAMGIAILPIASLGAGLTTANYQKSFISIAAMGGCYLVFGLFFANISMFPGKHRSRILSILVVGFILITIALVARAAKCYYQGRTVSDNKQPSGSVPQKHNNKNSQGSASRRAVELSSQVQVNVPDAHKTTKPRNRLAIGGGLVSFAQRVATPKPSPEELADTILAAVDFGVRTSPDLGLRTELQKDDNQFSETIQHHFSNKRTSHICIGNMYVSNNPLTSYDILPEEFFRKIICEEIQLHFSRGISPVTVSITEHCNDEGRLHLNIRGYINSIIYNDKLSHEVICELALDWTDQADHSGRPSSIYTRNKKATKVFVAKRTIFNMKERSQHLHDVCRAIIQSSFKEEPEFWSVIYNTTEVQ